MLARSGLFLGERTSAVTCMFSQYIPCRVPSLQGLLLVVAAATFSLFVVSLAIGKRCRMYEVEYIIASFRGVIDSRLWREG